MIEIGSVTPHGSLADIISIFINNLNIENVCEILAALGYTKERNI